MISSIEVQVDAGPLRSVPATTLAANMPLGGAPADLRAHIASETPHPAYDGVDLALLYENAKV